MLGLKRLGRRGGVLALLSVLWIGAAAQVIASHEPYDPARAVLHERIPLGWRVGLWSVSAAIMLVGAVAGNRCPSWQRAGYGAALFMPAERAMGYAWSLWQAAWPGYPPGAWSSIAGLAQWVTVGAVVLVVAGWDEDVTDALAREEDHP